MPETPPSTSTAGRTQSAAAKPMHRSVVGIVLAAAFILSLPLLAMQFTDEVDWNPADFAVAGALLVGTGLMYVLATRTTADIAYRAGFGVALAAALLLVWVNLAVGVIGSEDNPANTMYLGVLAVGFIAALVARFRPRGMARALLATALAQGLVAVIAVSAGLGSPVNGPGKILAVNGLFVALFVGSALLFRRATRERDEPGVEPTA